MLSKIIFKTNIKQTKLKLNLNFRIYMSLKQKLINSLEFCHLFKIIFLPYNIYIC